MTIKAQVEPRLDTYTPEEATILRAAAWNLETAGPYLKAALDGLQHTRRYGWLGQVAAMVESCRSLDEAMKAQADEAVTS